MSFLSPLLWALFIGVVRGDALRHPRHRDRAGRRARPAAVREAAEARSSEELSRGAGPPEGRAGSLPVPRTGYCSRGQAWASRASSAASWAFSSGVKSGERRLDRADAGAAGLRDECAALVGEQDVRAPSVVLVRLAAGVAGRDRRLHEPAGARADRRRCARRSRSPTAGRMPRPAPRAAGSAPRSGPSGRDRRATGRRGRGRAECDDGVVRVRRPVRGRAGPQPR